MTNFQLELDDAFVGRCGEILLTKKRLLVFQCLLCGCDANAVYGQNQTFLQHLATEHAKFWLKTEEPNTSKINCNNQKDKQDIDAVIKEEGEEFYENDDNLHLMKQFQEEELEMEIGDDINNEVLSDDDDWLADDPITTADPDGNDDGPFASQPTEQHTSNEMNKRFRTSNKEMARIKAAFPRNSAGKYVCDECGVEFGRLQGVRYHKLRKHTEQTTESLKPHVCDVCSYRAAHKYQLEIHYRTHTGERPFICPTCGITCKSKTGLNRHSLRHGNRRPYKCTECEASFYDHTAFRQHKSTHSDERPFSCEICKMAFKLRKSLNAHLKIHENLREFVCSICSAAFNQKVTLTLHLKNKHKIVKGSSNIKESDEVQNTGRSVEKQQ